MSEPIIKFRRGVWLHCLSELKAKTKGRHESGCFVLGGHAALAEVPTTALRYHRLIVRPFEAMEEGKSESEHHFKIAR